MIERTVLRFEADVLGGLELPCLIARGGEDAHASMDAEESVA
jgi:hypothetical protein